MQAQPAISHAALIASYLDLIERGLLNTIYEDPTFDPWIGGSYKPEARRLGRDWPSVAHTMIGEMRLHNFRALIEQVITEGVQGDIIETGVWRGGACIMARAVLKAHHVTDRTVWVADSFQGLPKPDPTRYRADDGDRHFEMDQLAVSMEMVQENFRKYGLLDQQVKFLRGWFKDTLPTAPIEKLAVLRLDGDMYQSTMEAPAEFDDRAPARAGTLYHRTDRGTVERRRAITRRDNEDKARAPRFLTGALWPFLTDFDCSHFYAQHLDDEELAHFMNKIGSNNIANTKVLWSRDAKGSATQTSWLAQRVISWLCSRGGKAG